MSETSASKPAIRRPIPITPRATIDVLTGPIGILASKETQSETGKKFWQAADVMYAQSLSVNNPLNEDQVADFVQTGIEKTEELIREKGTYANTEEGNYAKGWLYQLNGARDVIEGRRQDSRPLHDVVDQVSKVREQRAADAAKAAGKQGLGVSADGNITYTQYANPGSEKIQAENTLTRTKRESKAVKDWVTGQYGAPKDSW